VEQPHCRRLIDRHLLSATPLLKISHVQHPRHLEKSRFTAPVVFDRRAVRDSEKFRHRARDELLVFQMNVPEIPTKNLSCP
jgi:hypothetical protein